MKYRMINKELRIADISVSELSMNYVQNILSQWEEGTEIGTLTLFHDVKDDLIVLNRDNKGYKTYLDLAKGILSASAEDIIRLEDQAPECLSETVRVVIECRKIRLAQSEINKALKNVIAEKHEFALSHIIKTQKNVSGVMIAFRYGMMCGKREERARRKKQNGFT